MPVEHAVNCKTFQKIPVLLDNSDITRFTMRGVPAWRNDHGGRTPNPLHDFPSNIHAA